MNQCMNCDHWCQSTWMLQLGDCSELIAATAFGGAVLLEKTIAVKPAEQQSVITHGTFGCNRFQKKDDY